ncbi:MAG: electron transport complex subunit RsxC [Clostridiales bacterium]|nr:electron transport complex subunit RsxC [Clostridiales bacterium]
MKISTFTFPRGIHPHDHKRQTDFKPTEKILPAVGELMTCPMVQHLGAPCEPVVAAGESVLLGQKVGDSDKPMSAPVHASVSGVVKEIRTALTPTGITCKAVVIENDGLDNPFTRTANAPTPSRKETLSLIREAGVVGLGGAGFPTHIKLNPPPGKIVKHVIVNGSECEPYLTTDHRAMLEDAERLISGLKIILTLFDDATGIIAVENNKQNAIDELARHIRNESSIQIARVITKYPQGAEKQLIYALTKREVPSGGLPADVGCVVCNVDTVIAIERAVHRKRSLVRRIVTVAGGVVKNPGNYEVRLGMSYRSLVDRIGGFTQEPYKLVSGGPMMGVAMYTLDVPVTKTSSALLCFTKAEANFPPERDCIRCGRCVDHCPARLMPLVLNQNVIYGEDEEFIKNHGLDCIECGSCSFVCPSKRYLAQSIRAARRTALAARKR